MSDNSTPRRPNWAALGVAVFLAVFAIVILKDMARLTGAAGYSPVGPTTVPRWIAWGMIALSAATAIQALRGTALAAEPIRTPMSAIWVVLGLLLQIQLLHPMGFTIATGLMFACVARGYDERRWYISLPVGLILSFLVYAVFSQLLNLSLPAGWLELAVF